MSFNDIKVSSKVLTRSIYFELFIFPIKFFGILNKVGGIWVAAGLPQWIQEAAWREKVYIVLVYTYKGKGGGGILCSFLQLLSLLSTLRHIFIVLSSNKHAQLFTEMPTASEAETAAASCSLLVVWTTTRESCGFGKHLRREINLVVCIVVVRLLLLLGVGSI